MGHPSLNGHYSLLIKTNEGTCYTNYKWNQQYGTTDAEIEAYAEEVLLRQGQGETLQAWDFIVTNDMEDWNGSDRYQNHPGRLNVSSPGANKRGSFDGFPGNLPPIDPPGPPGG